eukprot:Skav230938  [mRNA]  locus=scaffold2774:141417:144554:- [translate_table: standard]
MGNAVGFGNAETLGNVAVERENFCQRLGNSLCGVCFGLILFVGSIGLLGWNEFNYVRNQAVLLKVEKETIEAGCTPSAANVGKPIWASCNVMRTYDFSKDPRVTGLGLQFSDKLEGAWFKTESSILQWVEDKDCSSHSTAGGGREKVCTYDYDLKWTNSPQPSSEFYCYPNWRPGCTKSGSQIKNYGTIPSLLQQTSNAPSGSVGMGSAEDKCYLLDNAELGVFPATSVGVYSGQTSSVLPDKKVWVLGSGGVQFSSNPGMDSVGDVKTTFTQSLIHLGFTQVCMIALQGGMSGGDAQMRAWDTQLPGTMSLVDWAMTGGFSKSEMISLKQSENGYLVLGLRLAGFILMWLGLQLVTGPIALMPQIVPCCGEMIGEMVGCMLCCMNCLISLSLSLTVIGVAWLLARPVLGVGLLLVAAAAVFGALMLRKKFGKSSREPSISQPFMGQQYAQQMPQQVTPAVPPTQMEVTIPQGCPPGSQILVPLPNGTQQPFTDLEQQFEAAANLIAKGTPSKGSASTDETRQGNLCSTFFD